MEPVSMNTRGFIRMIILIRLPFIANIRIGINTKTFALYLYF